MTPTDFERWIVCNSFEEVGEFVIDGGRVLFQRKGEPFNESGLVYLWVAFQLGHDPQVLYVGKAGSTIDARMRQHRNGFLSIRGAGFKNRGGITAALAAGNRVTILARCSDKITCFGQTVSQCATEEAALIRLLRPTLNGKRPIATDTDWKVTRAGFGAG